jgi:hypothetical protein
MPRFRPQPEEQHSAGAMIEEKKPADGKTFAIEDAHYYEARPEGFFVGSWSPSPPGTPDAKVTQVHLHIPLAGVRILARFKGPKLLDELIDSLVKHREHVWGKR